jgi:hypothetical protein
MARIVETRAEPGQRLGASDGRRRAARDQIVDATRDERLEFGVDVGVDRFRRPQWKSE